MNRLRVAAMCLGLSVVMLVSACTSNPSVDLTGKAWQWTSQTQAGTPTPMVVPSPSSYTATFNIDGTINVKADCITANGTYTYQSSGSLGVPSIMTIALGPTTLPQCSAGSLSNVFLALLPKAASFTIDTSNVLKITLSDGGTLSFQ